MDNNETGFNNPKEIKYLIIGLLPAILLILSIIIVEILKGNELSIKKILSISYGNVIVEKVYINKRNHNFEYMILSTGVNNYNTFGLKEGDTLRKARGDSILYIKNKNYNRTINTLETYRKIGWIK